MKPAPPAGAVPTLDRQRLPVTNPGRKVNEISTNQAYRFGEFTLDPGRAGLFRGDEELRLRRRTFEVLTYLVRQSGRVVSKQELFEAVWGDVVVTDDSLVQCLVEIRKALGDDQDRVKTVRGRGYLFEGAVSESSGPARAEDPVIQRTTPAALPRGTLLVVLAIAVLGGGVWLFPRSRTDATVSTLAVLPFTHTSAGDPSDLVGGLHEEVVSALGQIDPERLRVLSRRSTVAYVAAGKSAARIGQELGADYVVEGVIRERGATWHITFTVVNARDQVQVWSGTFDRDRSTILYLQTELGRAVAQQIRLRVSATQDQALVRRQARHPQAYEHYLRGRALWAKPNRAALFAAIDEYKQATALDPEYALAYAGLADAYSALPITSDVPPREVAEHAREAALHAVQADGLLAEAHAALGWQEFWFGWNWPAAEASLRRAIALDPNYANARRSLGHLLSNAGRHSEALAEMARARELDPFSPLMHVLSAQTAYNARDFAAAERHARQSVAIDPNFWGAYVNLGQALAGQGRFEEALVAIAEGYRLAGNAKGLTRRGYVLARMGRTAEAKQLLRDLEQTTRLVPPYEIAAVNAGLGDANGVFAWLEKAYGVRDANLVFLPVDPKMDPFRADPRFQSLLDRCGFTRKR
jgi:DNA-binding winged helix-turn-helix (wHTH) protein/TolB-like protein/Tfp pilus assembly protein PilF